MTEVEAATVGKPGILPKETFKKLHEASLKTFLKEQQGSGPSDSFWNSIINSGDAAKRKDDGEARKARYTSTNKLLTGGLEQNLELVWAAKRWAVVDVWIRWVATLLNLNFDYQFRT